MYRNKFSVEDTVRHSKIKPNQHSHYNAVNVISTTTLSDWPRLFMDLGWNEYIYHLPIPQTDQVPPLHELYLLLQMSIWNDTDLPWGLTVFLLYCKSPATSLKSKSRIKLHLNRHFPARQLLLKNVYTTDHFFLIGFILHTYALFFMVTPERGRVRKIKHRGLDLKRALLWRTSCFSQLWPSIAAPPSWTW